MHFLENTFWTKRITALVSFVIVASILWNTYTFFQRFKDDERAKITIYAEAIKEISMSQDANASFNLETIIFEEIKNIPLILTTQNDSIIYSSNLGDENDYKYLKKQLELMKNENQPIEIKLEKESQFVYYKDSDLLNKLTYYPLALILILMLFISVIYLFYSSSKASEANKLWTGMAKETAHQIGTPLSSLLGWIAILKTGKVEDTYIDEIEKDVYRLNAIADRFSKIGSAPELKNNEIVSITKTAFEYLKLRSSKQISFYFSSDSEVIFANVNVELFGWVIENLIRNAIDAMPGKGNVHLKIENNQKNIKILVTDTGKGMSKKRFKQIFKPGFTTKKRGWGLGLSLSKRIIEEYHNGKIFVKKSEIGKGTTFQILLKKNQDF